MSIAQPSGMINSLPSKKSRLEHGTLTAIGVFQEVHGDGHEKYSHTVLRMGPLIGVDIYGFHDHTGRIHHMDVIPNACDADTVGHVYLDFIEKYEGEIIC
jgi:hypothetical protein